MGGLLLEKDDAIFYAFLRMGHECTHAIIPDPDPLSKRIENEWLIEVEHGQPSRGFCYRRTWVCIV